MSLNSFWRPLGWGGVALIMLTLALSAGIWTRTETLHGPFHDEPSPSKALIVALPSHDPPLMTSEGESPTHQSSANLRLSVNGKIWSQSSALHDRIRRGDFGAYSHWSRQLYFSLQPGVRNNQSLQIQIRYDLRPYPLTVVMALALGIALLWGQFLAVKNGKVPGPAIINRLLVLALNCFRLLLPTLSWAVTAAAVGYVLSIALALAIRDPLPTAAIFKWTPDSDRLAAAAAQWPMWALSLALLIVTAISFTPKNQRQRWRAVEIWLVRFWGVWLAPVLILVFALAASASGWSGKMSPLQQNYLSIAGLVPYSDSGGHWHSSELMAQTGKWADFAARRPIAASLRQAISVLSHYSYAGAILLQSTLVALALTIAGKAIWRWAGVWAALAFIAAIFALARPFLATTMTEPLAMVLALLAVAPTIRAVEHRKFADIILAVGLIMLALLVRMGAMLWIPALMIWAVRAARGPKIRNTVGIITIAVGALMMETLLSPYLPPGHATGGNVGLSLCGLARNTDWGECYNAFQPEISRLGLNAAKANSFFIQKAISEFESHPTVLIRAMFANAVRFIREFPNLLWNGYVPIAQTGGVAVILGLACMLPNLYSSFRSHDLIWKAFWACLILMTIGSSAVIYRDDGARTLLVTHVFLVMMLSLGFVPARSPRVRLPTRFHDETKRDGIILSTIVATIVLAPVAALALNRAGADSRAAAHALPGQVIVAGGHRLTGFIVYKSGEKVPRNAPTLDQAEFGKIWSQANFSSEWQINLADLPAPPFAVLTGPKISAPDESSTIFIAPVEVLANRDVSYWAMRTHALNNSNETGKVVIRIVDKVAPVELPKHRNTTIWQ